MNLPQILLNRQFKRVATAIATALLIFIIINIFVIGGDLFIFTFNGGINSPLAILITLSAITVWNLMSEERHNRFLWSGIFIGWGFWALAETIWTVYSFFGKEVPYPSLADLFWIIGYFPMGIGLITRARTMPTKPTLRQNILIFGFSVITILSTIFFIFIPIIQGFDPQRLVESILNLAYPLADLFLVIIVLHLLFTYEEGDYGFVWRLLTLGFIFMTISDFMFTYTSWQGLYYPDMKANLISRLGVDVPYTISYLIWFTGIYALNITLREEQIPIVEPIVKVRMVRTYGHILIYTKKDNTVIDVSTNYNRFFKEINIIGKSFADALTISEQAENTILEKIKNERRLADLPLQIWDREGVLQEVKLCGLVAVDPQNGYLGGNFLLRMRVADTSFDDVLTPESRSMTMYILDKSGSSNKPEIGQFLLDYHFAYIKSLLDMAFHQGGEPMSQALLEQFQKISKIYKWNMQFNLQTVLDGNDYTIELLREALPILLETAKEFVSDITDPSIVESRMKEVSSRLNKTIHSDFERYRKAGREDVEFADHRKRNLGI